MTKEDNIRLQAQGFELLCSQARIIAMLPLEDWLSALELAETIGPVLDPTLYRDYLYSQKPEILKEIIRAAIPLKKAVLKAQPFIKETLKGVRDS